MTKFDEISPEIWQAYDEVAAEAQARSFQYMKIVAPSPGAELDWRVGDFFVTDEQAIVLADCTAVGWSRLKDGKRVEEHYQLALSGSKPARPNSFTDQSKWDHWDNGNPKDPWIGPAYKLPLKFTTGPLAGKVVIISSDKINRFAIGEILHAFAHTHRRPLVRLTSVKADGDRGFEPTFQIMKFLEDDEDIPGLVPFLVTKDVTVSVSTASPPPKGNGHTDMNDDIPF